MRRKRSLRQRIMSVFLSAVLVAGMTLNATPITAHAAENAEVSDSNEATVIENNAAVEETKEASLTDNADAEDSQSEAEAEETESSISVTIETEDAESNASVTTEADNAENNISVMTETEDTESSTSVTTETNNAESSASVTTEGENTEEQETVSGNDAPEMQPENAQPQEIPMPQTQKMQTELYSVSTLAATQTYTSGDGKYEYTVNGDDKVTITKYKGSGTNITIPDTIDEKTVTVIGESAFRECTNLTTVTIPEGVTSIGNSAFYKCTSLINVTIPSSVTSIGSSAFRKTNLTTVTIPEGVTEIGSSAFYCCKSLQTVTIPEGVTKIGFYAFYETDLTEITIPESVKDISNSAFADINITYSGCKHKWKNVYKHQNNYSKVKYNNSSMTSVAGTEATCIQAGNKAYYECSGCNKWFKDVNGTNEIIDKNSVVIQKKEHEYDTSKWKSDSTKHWYECTCGAKKDEATHSYGDWKTDGKKHWHECTSCGAKKDVDGHSYGDEWKTDGTNYWRECVCGAKQAEGEHEMTRVNESAATCTEKGNILYYICQVCNKWFADISGNNEITDKNSVVIQKKEHVYDTSKWKSDSTNHWYECTCGAKKDEAAHNYGEWNVTTPATETEKGLQERSCTACGYKQTEEIPVKESETTDIDKTDAGKIETDKEQGENVPVTDFSTPNKDLIDAVLTPEEQSFVEDGTDIKIILDIDNIDASVKQADKQAVTDKADGYEVGQYLDINLYKLIGTDKTKISKTSGKIKITIAVPEALKNTDSKKARSYAVVRVHDGKSEILTDLDNDEATITIETDLFSTYAIVYKEAAGTDANNNSGDKDNAGKKDDVPETGDEMPVEIYATLAMIAGFTYLIMLFGGRRKGMTEEKKKELTDSIIAWGKKGGKIRRLIALGIIFIILCYYHSIGKDTELDLQDIMLNP